MHIVEVADTLNILSIHVASLERPIDIELDDTTLAFSILVPAFSRLQLTRLYTTYLMSFSFLRPNCRLPSGYSEIRSYVVTDPLLISSCRNHSVPLPRIFPSGYDDRDATRSEPAEALWNCRGRTDQILIPAGTQRHP